jgi:SAM-dependent methyltransferase
VQNVVAKLPEGCRVLEVGCGNGTLLRALTEVCTGGMVVGMDLFGEGLAWAKKRSGCPLVRGDVFSAPFSGRVDVIGMFDVLEHLDDDLGALSSLRGMLVPDGTLVLTVPAHPALWSYFDEYSHHRRRYKLGELNGKLTKSGYRVQYITEYMCSLLPLIWLGRKISAMLPSRKPRSTAEMADSDLRIVPVLNDLIGWTLSWESGRVARRRRLPFGASIIAVAKPV